MRTRTEECKTRSSCCSRCTQRLSRVTRRTTLSPTRGRIRWRHGGDYRSDMIRRQRKKRNLLRTIISPGPSSLLELQAGIERWESYVSRYEKKTKDKLDDEIKLAGLGSLVPEELDKTFEMRFHFEKLVNWYGKNELILVYLENNMVNFYLNRELKSTETNNVNNEAVYPKSALVCVTCCDWTSASSPSLGAAQRRRQRRLRSWLRHQRMTVSMALAESTHHSSRGQKNARAGV